MRRLVTLCLLVLVGGCHKEAVAPASYQIATATHTTELAATAAATVPVADKQCATSLDACPLQGCSKTNSPEFGPHTNELNRPEQQCSRFSR